MDDPLLLALGLAIGILAALLVTVPRAHAERRAAEAQRALLEQDPQRLRDAFRALSAEALHASNEEFLRLARATLDGALRQAQGDLGQREQAIQGLVQPLRESLAGMQEQVKQLEQRREAAYGQLQESLRGLGEAQAQWQREAGALSQALRNPQVRGRWGELTLRRAVELAGLVEHCDFSEQATLGACDARRRPDLVVLLPAGRSVAVDAKAPLDAYLDHAQAASEDERRDALARHARQLRAHVRDLGGKAYWQGLERSPEFVVLFLPGEPFLGAALQADPALLEDAAAQNVVLATPATLIALLRAVAQGWREERVAESAEALRTLGAELHERLGTLAEHLAGVGKNLGRSVESYNKLVGSYESRVLPSARRLHEAGVAQGKPPEDVEPVTVIPRAMQAEL